MGMLSISGRHSEAAARFPSYKRPGEISPEKYRICLNPLIIVALSTRQSLPSLLAAS